MNLCKTPREASKDMSADFLVSDFYNFSLAPHGVGGYAGLGWCGARESGWNRWICKIPLHGMTQMNAQVRLVGWCRSVSLGPTSRDFTAKD